MSFMTLCLRDSQRSDKINVSSENALSTVEFDPDIAITRDTSLQMLGYSFLLYLKMFCQIIAAAKGFSDFK